MDFQEARIVDVVLNMLSPISLKIVIIKPPNREQSCGFLP